MSAELRGDGAAAAAAAAGGAALPPLTFGERLVAACGSGALASLIVCPVERTKIVMQSRKRFFPTGGTAAAALALAREGTLYRGYVATLAREVLVMLFQKV